VQVKRVRQEKDAKRMAIGVPLSAIRLGRAAESKMKQDASKGRGAAADSSGSRVKFSKSSEVFKQLVLPPPYSLFAHPPILPCMHMSFSLSLSKTKRRGMPPRAAAAVRTCL
jgi:hypothetical protein